MPFPKFIIETRDKGDCLIIAKCKYHKQLVSDKDKVKGGGWWILDRENSTFTLHGNSHDFGAASMEDIKNCVLNKNVFTSRSLNKNLSNFIFKYQDQIGVVTKL